MAKDKEKRERRIAQPLDEEIPSTLDDASLHDLFRGEEVSPLLEKVAAALEKMKYDCRILLITSYGYEIAPAKLARITRTTMEYQAEASGMNQTVWTRLKMMFGNLERQMKERRDTCFEKLRAEVRPKGS